jgi:hypothetical protein
MLTSNPSIVERTSRVLQWAFDIVFMAGAVCIAGYVAITIGYVATIWALLRTGSRRCDDSSNVHCASRGAL